MACHRSRHNNKNPNGVSEIGVNFLVYGLDWKSDNVLNILVSYEKPISKLMRHGKRHQIFKYHVLKDNNRRNKKGNFVCKSDNCCKTSLLVCLTFKYLGKVSLKKKKKWCRFPTT